MPDATLDIDRPKTCASPHKTIVKSNTYGKLASFLRNSAQINLAPSVILWFYGPRALKLKGGQNRNYFGAVTTVEQIIKLEEPRIALITAASNPFRENLRKA